jgi:RNA polymerase subunit RPABC4/transcription elongation factor Spt4
MGFLDSLRKGADRAQLEANKLVRINRVQSQINTLKQQIQQRIVQLGEKTLELHRTKQLSEPDLVALCEGIIALEKEITEKEAEIEAIKQEVLPEGVAAAPATYGHICPQCKINLPQEADFCPNCGSKAVDIPPPTPIAATTVVKCTNCGATLVEGAKFCLECGTKVEIEQQVTQLPGQVCPECQSFLPEGAVFCPNCGAKVGEEPTPVSKTTDASEAETAL